MPAIKLKKVTAEYLAEKEKEEKLKEKARKNLEDVAKEKNEDTKEAEDTEDVTDEKPHNFLDVEILFDKRKRMLPLPEQRLIEWLDSNLIAKEDVRLPLGVLYEYYSEVCQMQGQSVVHVPVFNKYVRDRFGKTFGFQENSPYKVLIREKKLKSKPKVQGQTLQMKLQDILREVISEMGNPRQGIRFLSISKAIMQKYPAQRVDIHFKKLKHALERGVASGSMECTKGVGRCGYYRLRGEPTKEEPEEKKKDEKPDTEEEETGAGETEEEKEAGETGEEKEVEGEKETNGETVDGEEESVDEEKEADEEEAKKEKAKKSKKKTAKKKSKPFEKWVHGGVERHSNPERVEDIFPLAITYQTDPKIASGGKIKDYISRYYREDLSFDRLKKTLEKGVAEGLWECVSGKPPQGRFHLLVETFMPGRSDKLKDQIAQAIVACNEPKQASAVMLKKYIIQYHPKFNIENRTKSFKHALERACEKGILKQLSGIGTTGTFQLTSPFNPSPAILAGDASDSEEEDEPDSDEEEPEYVPRPTKRGRLAPKLKPQPFKVLQQAKKSKSKVQPPKRKASSGKARGAKSSSPRYYEVSSESESEVELEVEYTPSPSRSRGGGIKEEKSSRPPTATKRTSNSRGKATPQNKTFQKKTVANKTKCKVAKSPAIIASDSEESGVEDKTKAEYTQQPSQSRRGGQTPASKASAKLGGSARGRLVEASDKDTPQKSKQGTAERRSRNVGKRSYVEVDEDIDSEPDSVAAPPSKKKKSISSTGKTPKSAKR